jgi:hypothetical protein
MSGDLADLNQWNAYAYAGTRQKGYYAQLSGTIVDQYHFNLSDNFTPSTRSNTLGFQSNFPYEDGGLREHSNFEDWRVNAKAGITPNSTDEYSLNYTSQHGEKGARSASIVRSCRDISSATTAATGIGRSGTSRRCPSSRRRRWGKPRT